MDSRCGLCVDVANTAPGGVNVLQAIRAATPPARRAHQRHARLWCESTLRDVGDGVLPIPGIFRELEKLNYSGYVNLEYEIDADNPVYGMARSSCYMRGVFGMRG